MFNICVLASKYTEESSWNLSIDLGAKWLKTWDRDLTKYDLVVNYGNSDTTIIAKKLINTPEAVGICINKISTLKRVEKECRAVQWTKDKDIALRWAYEDRIVVARTNQEGSQGKGLFLCESYEEFLKVNARFYTRYFWHDREFRVDVFKGRVLAIYEKQRDENNCWDFVHCPLDGVPPELEKMVSAVTKNIKIDFCGLDVLVNKEGKACLLEVNSGPILNDETAKVLIPLLKKEV